MAEKLKIEIYRKKEPEELTKALADAESRTEIGSGAALTASVAAAYLERCAALTLQESAENERAAYILRNAETIRAYMVHLIDEDVKSRGPLRRAMKEGDPQTIEAAYQPAVAIPQEIVNMMGQTLDFLAELAAFCPQEAKHFAAAAAELAMGAVQASIRYILSCGQKSSDPTYRYVLRRENELTLEQYRPVYEDILAKAGE